MFQDEDGNRSVTIDGIQKFGDLQNIQNFKFDNFNKQFEEANENFNNTNNQTTR